MKRPGGFLPSDSEETPSESEAAVPSGEAAAPKRFAQKFVHFTRKTSVSQFDSVAGSVPNSLVEESSDPDNHPTETLDSVVIRVGEVSQDAEIIALPSTGLFEPAEGRAELTQSALLRHDSPKFSLRSFVKKKPRAEVEPHVGSAVLNPGDSFPSDGSVIQQSEADDGLTQFDPVAQAERELKIAARARKKTERRELRRFTSYTRSRKRHWLIGAGSVLLLAAFVLIGVCSPLMAVQKVEVVGAQQVDAAELEGALQRFTGVPLALIGEEELHRTLEPFPLIQRYSVERIPPDTLRVNIEERQPVIAIAGDNGYRMVDAAGVLTGEVAEVLPGIVRASGSVVDTASIAFAAAATVVRDLPEDIRVQIAEVSASSDQDISFVLHSGVVAAWGEALDTQRKAVVLRAMLSAVGGATQIDVSAPEAPVFQ